MSHLRMAQLTVALGALVIVMAPQSNDFWDASFIELLILGITIITVMWPLCIFVRTKWIKRSPFRVTAQECIEVGVSEIPIIVTIRRNISLADYGFTYHFKHGGQAGGDTINIGRTTKEWMNGALQPFNKGHREHITLRVDARKPVDGYLKVYAIAGLSRQWMTATRLTVVPKSMQNTEPSSHSD